MDLATLFSLIFASFLGLLPVLLLIGRRARTRRDRVAPSGADGAPTAGGLSRVVPGTSGDNASSRGSDDSMILRRIMRGGDDSPGQQQPRRQLERSFWQDDSKPMPTESWPPLGQELSPEQRRELRDAATMEGAVIWPQTPTGAWRPGSHPPNGGPRVSVYSTSVGGSMDQLHTAMHATDDDPDSLTARLGRVEELRRGIIYAEILGPPVALRARPPGTDR